MARTRGAMHGSTSMRSQQPNASNTNQVSDKHAIRTTPEQAVEEKYGLAMIHHSEVYWTGNVGTWSTEGNGTLNQDNPVYQHGGSVHRIFWDRQLVDCMVCDPSFCYKCGPNTNVQQPSSIMGLPFVHSSELEKEDDKFIFSPSVDTVIGQEHDQVFPAVRARTITFKIDEPSGETINTLAAVCDFTDCRTCQAKMERHGQKDTNCSSSTDSDGDEEQERSSIRRSRVLFALAQKEDDEEEEEEGLEIIVPVTEPVSRK